MQTAMVTKLDLCLPHTRVAHPLEEPQEETLTRAGRHMLLAIR